MKEVKTKKDISGIRIDPPDKAAAEKAKSVFDGIAKPLDGLGDLEGMICRIAGIMHTEDINVGRRAAVIMCADNGIVEEGVSQSGKEVTLAVARALGKGISSACTLGRAARVDVIPVDIGIDCDERIRGVRDHKVAKGTRNFLKQPAMTEKEMLKALETGIEITRELKKSGYDMLITGEMGIGNTTTSTAVLAAALDLDSDGITGRGAGIDDEGLSWKKEVIREALGRYRFNDEKDEAERAFNILRSVGGLDIAGLAGLAIGGALCKVPVVLDGLISSAAAVIADMMVPGVRDYLLPSHAGREKGNMSALSYLGLSPYLNCNMALGEGTGGILLFSLIDAVYAFYKNAAGFSDYCMDEYRRHS